MEVSGQLHAPVALPQETCPLYPLNRRLCGHQTFGNLNLYSGQCMFIPLAQKFSQRITIHSSKRPTLKRFQSTSQCAVIGVTQSCARDEAARSADGHIPEVPCPAGWADTSTTTNTASDSCLNGGDNLSYFTPPNTTSAAQKKLGTDFRFFCCSTDMVMSTNTSLLIVKQNDGNWNYVT